MSISYLLSPNDYTIYCKTLTSDQQTINETITQSIITQELNLSNTLIYTVNLTYYTNVGMSYILLVPNIQIKSTLLDRFVYLEIPQISVNLPGSVENEFYLTQDINGTSIPFPFNFKYDTYQLSTLLQSGTNTVITYRTTTGNNSPIFINKLDNSLFSGGNSVFNATVLTFVRNV